MQSNDPCHTPGFTVELKKVKDVIGNLDTFACGRTTVTMSDAVTSSGVVGRRAVRRVLPFVLVCNFARVGVNKVMAISVTAVFVHKGMFLFSVPEGMQQFYQRLQQDAEERSAWQPTVARTCCFAPLDVDNDDEDNVLTNNLPDIAFWLNQ